MFPKILLITLAMCCTSNKAQDELRDDQNITALIYSYDYYEDDNSIPKRGDLGEITKNISNTKRRKRSLNNIRGDQGPPPDDFDYYTNFIDEEPVRGDLGKFLFNSLGNNGGSTTDITQFPYQVSLVKYNNNTDQWEHNCGGSILSQNIIITAAHCTYIITKSTIKLHKVRIGSSSSISGGELFNIDKIINHEYYNNLNIDNDVAILILKKIIKFSRKVNRISIASSNRPAGTRSLVSGWGYLDENTLIPSPNLNYINVSIIEREKCNKAYEDFEPLTDSMICTGHIEGRKNACSVDSGGPLVEGGELIGIVSWGIGCGYKNRPVVYTNVFYMGEWIIDKMNLYSCQSSTGNRIVGGATADITQFPYQISLTKMNFYTEEREHICGGSILSKNIIVTAAHCTQGPPALLKSFQVRVGSSSSLKGGNLIQVADIIDHEDYNGYTIDNDISILVLAENLVFSPSVQPISIASKERLPGALCVVSGWGYLFANSNVPSPVLNYVQVPLIGKSVCQSKYFEGEELTKSMMCAGYPQGGKDSCTTDSGGPLAEGEELVGIVSWGIGCGAENSPGVYTDVFYMADWIKDKMQKYSV
ncbi:coagulation factor X-like [Condylostylus longicornis]|uniref:coagulation factor X-like n=1 Tax=Condylostylus longicornis TaxID=2530218 RepID=UPI00244E1B2D|nr:coagulation factor X-like [Condylostylus longicornis]